MSKLVIVYGCNCHKGNMYTLDSDDKVSKVVYECDSNDHVSIGCLLSMGGFKYKEITSIQTIINTVLSNLT